MAAGRALGKAVAVTEFGCASHRGAADLGGSELSSIEWGADGRPIRLTAEYVRDEDEQARHLRELLKVFDAEGVDGAFVYTFARYDLPHRSDPHEDFDLVSRGVVRVLEDRSGQPYAGMPWEPKAAFTALAEYYHG